MTSTEQQLSAQQLARRLFPDAGTLSVSKMQEGGSTWVYRIECDQTPFYLRILPEEDASFAPEAYVHSTLFARGLHVPEIIYFEHFNQEFQHSLMVTNAIAGAPIRRDDSLENLAPILRQAGRELAVINQLPVDGFGWVQRTSSMPDEVRGEYPTFALWMTTEIDQALSVFESRRYLSAAKLTVLAQILAQAIEQAGNDTATVAHGDFDATHIFSGRGDYTGIIDFGEIRGTNRAYDLGHFSIENSRFLPALLEGYGEIVPLPGDISKQIQQMALLISVARAGRRLARSAEALEVDHQLIENTLQMNHLP